MVTLNQYKSGIKLPEYDYLFDKMDKVEELLKLLTPKFDGVWTVILLNPSITYTKTVVLENIVPEFVNCLIYLNKQSMNTVLLDIPSLQPKIESNWDTYMSYIKDLKHSISSEAAHILYKSFNGNLDMLRSELQKLDAECTDGITTDIVKRNYIVIKNITAHQLLLEFLQRGRYRWKHYDDYVKNLGIELAYYALRKQVKQLLQDKSQYLNNQDIKNVLAMQTDAPLICYLYMLFNNSNSPQQLPCIFADLDNRSTAVVERILC